MSVVRVSDRDTTKPLGNDLSRRQLLQASLGVAAVRSMTGLAAEPIDRQALVRRHTVVLHKWDPLAPLSVGNGEFAFTVDLTGLQTFPAFYEKGIPLCTLSNWGWHRFPLPTTLRVEDFQPEYYECHGRKVPYWTRSKGQEELYRWLRENPHRFHLGLVGLAWRNTEPGTPTPDDLTGVRQELDLWAGRLTSEFRLQGKPVMVETCCHPQLDLIGVRIQSELLASRRLWVVLRFPYASSELSAADWARPQLHHSRLVGESNGNAVIQRELDTTTYFVALRWDGSAELVRDGTHEFSLRPAQGQAVLELSVLFTPTRPTQPIPQAREALSASERFWESFWSSGGAVELSESADPRAKELERRLVLSQYLTAIQCSGSLPPQESGLTCNSWYGKFHLEMHWWHATHFALWGRLPMLERSLPWYRKILPKAKQTASWQGYRGARWPKMVGPEGDESPSPIGPLLIWQQPHPIFYAELCYRERPRRATLEQYAEIVFESAEFMAAYATEDTSRGRYVLGPPLIPAQENHPPQSTWNPTFELEYWLWGLETALRWRKRMGLEPEPFWQAVARKLSQPPVAQGVYLAHENCPETFSQKNYDHPSMLAALGMLPGKRIDRKTMRRTLLKVMREWQWDRTWGWDYPMAAMTAARLGEPEMAIDFLLMDTPKNRWLPNGHVWQRPNLPVYLPANGGLLYAVALMAKGWDGGPQRLAPGFPTRNWVVRFEGLRQAI